MTRRTSRPVLRAALLIYLLMILLGVSAPAAMAQANVTGQWSTLNYQMTINPVHVALMHNGKILVIAGSGNCPPSQSGCPTGPPYSGTNHSGATVLDPVAKTLTQLTLSWDMFCNSMTVLQDGRVFVNGGTVAYDPFLGQTKSSIFDPATNTFTDTPTNMVHGRWYPTVTMLPDGRVMTFSGQDENANTNNRVEIYTVGTGWSPAYTASWTPPLYPRQHLLPNGNVFVSGPAPTTYSFNPSTQVWTPVATTKYGGTRTFGSSVLLPLTPANNYDPRVMLFGGATSATQTTEWIDLGAGSPTWTFGPDMSAARVEMDAVLLPNGKIVALGGSASDEVTPASLNADLYDPVALTRTSAGTQSYARLYHSVALLLPDATIWSAGSNPVRGTWEPHMEIYQPPYLFNSDGSLATRPTITNAPGTIQWGGQFSVTTPDAANISQVVLMRPGSSTHAFDMDQRLVGMTFTAGSGTLTVTAPPNGKIAPPGYYMLFLINNNGVPSVAPFVLLNAGSNPAPTVSSIAPGTGTGSGGTSVTITGTGFLSGATVTLGGTPATGVTVVSSTSITATTPTHAAGAVNVVVTNTDGQSGTLTNGYTYSSGTGGGIVNFVQLGSATPQAASATATVTYPSAQTAGNLNVLAVGWNDTTSTVTGVTDSQGNTYVLAIGPTTGSGLRQSIYYAKNIAAGSNTVTVKFNQAAAAVDLRAMEYNGLDATNPLDITAGASGTGTTANSGTATTTSANELIFGAGMTAGGFTGAGTGFISRIITATDADIAEDQTVSTTGTYGATAVGSNSKWVMQMASFRASGQSSGNPAPTVSSILPNTGTTSGGTAVTITGTGFLSGATVTLGGMAATGVTVVSSTSITATTPAHTAGAVNVVVTNTDTQTGTLSGGYTYTNPAPTVSSITPNTGTASGGTAVTITGTGFLSGATVTLGGTPATGVTVVSGTSITATTPANGTGAVNVVVTNTDTQSGTLTNGYTYTAANPAPTVTSITPTTGLTAGGTAVTITGTGFLSGATVTLGGSSATGVTVVSPTSITATTPAHAAGAVNVVVKNTDSQTGTLTNGYTYTNPAPTVTSISPLSGTTSGGTVVTITGTGFLSGATVSLGGNAATAVTVVSATSITATTPAHAVGAVNVVVTNTDTQSGTLTNGYTYTSGGGGAIAFVQVKAATPQTASASVLVAFTAAQTAGNLNVVAVGWNDTTSTVTGVTDTRGNTYVLAAGPTAGTGLTQSIYYAKNIAAGTNTVTVTFNKAAAFADIRVLEYSGLDTSNPLDQTAAAAGSGTTASSGAATTTLPNELIFGAGMTSGGFTGAGTGFTSRIITTPDLDNAEDRTVSATGSYTATAPTSSAKWVMQMATFIASGQTSGNPAPTVSSISPNTGTANGGTGVTITGTGFLSGATVTLGGTPATAVTVVSATSITATTAAHATGAVDVVVTNTDTQTGTLSGGYTYTTANPAPTVTSITPNSGNTAGGTSVTITGTGFLRGATVSLGGTAATSVTVVSATSITAKTPAHATGAVNVVVTNTDTQSGTLTNGYTYTTANPAPTVTSITPNSGTTAGGTAVTITGTGFLSGATVTLGGTAATSVTVVSATSITATTPAHASGAVNVVVTNTDTQSGTLTNGYTYSSGGGAPIAFVQVKSATPQTASASVAVTFTTAQTLGNLNIVVVGWNDTTSTVSTVTDSRGNTYTLAIGPTTGTGLSQSIYYAKNIAAGTNTVTVTFNKAAAFVDIRALEYSGLNPTSPLDQTAGAAGSGTTASSGAATTVSANELIFGAGMTAAAFTGAVTGLVSRIITTTDADIAEDRTVDATGSYSATAPNK
ncbi:MAG: IPT/TIG domain-containing protein, partial [Terriglobales bacterium]